MYILLGKRNVFMTVHPSSNFWENSLLTTVLRHVVYTFSAIYVFKLYTQRARSFGLWEDLLMTNFLQNLFELRKNHFDNLKQIQH